MLRPGDLVCYDPEKLNEFQKKFYNLKSVFLLIRIPSPKYSYLDIATVLAEDQLFQTKFSLLKKYVKV